MNYEEERMKMLSRHKRELEELIAKERRENVTVTFQASSLSSDSPDPYTVEISFPDNLDYNEKSRVNTQLTHKLTQWLKDLGYRSQWLTPKDSPDPPMSDYT